jgi:hypothetical protein
MKLTLIDVAEGIKEGDKVEFELVDITYYEFGLEYLVRMRKKKEQEHG